LTARKRERPQK